MTMNEPRSVSSGLAGGLRSTELGAAVEAGVPDSCGVIEVKPRNSEEEWFGAALRDNGPKISDPKLERRERDGLEGGLDLSRVELGCKKDMLISRAKGGWSESDAVLCVRRPAPGL
jgi:hypothetical protein